MTGDVLMLTSFNHEAHRGFARAIGADTLDFRHISLGPLTGTPPGDLLTGFRYPEYDTYILEGSPTLIAAASLKATHDATVIYLAAERGMYALSSASPPTDRNSLVGSMTERFGGLVAQAVAQRTLDGVITVSDFVADYARAIVGPNTPIGVAHPYIQSDTYTRLGEVNPSLDSTTAVTVGRGMEYKNMETLVKSWPAVRDRHPDAELHIVGKGHSDKYENIPGVSVKGYVDDLGEALSPASLFIQPSDGDAFPVSTLEAMRAGLPPLVTATTGTRSEVRAVAGNLVVDTDSEALTRGIVDYFERPAQERRKLSDRARKRGQLFDPETRLAAFKNEFESLCDRIEN